MRSRARDAVKKRQKTLDTIVGARGADGGVMDEDEDDEGGCNCATGTSASRPLRVSLVLLLGVALFVRFVGPGGGSAI